MKCHEQQKYRTFNFFSTNRSFRNDDENVEIKISERSIIEYPELTIFHWIWNNEEPKLEETRVPSTWRFIHFVRQGRGRGSCTGSNFFFWLYFFFAKFIFRTEGAKLILIIEKILLPLKALRNQYRPLLSYILHTGAKKKNWNKKIKKKVREIIKVNEEETRFDE